MSIKASGSQPCHACGPAQHIATLRTNMITVIINSIYPPPTKKQTRLAAGNLQHGEEVVGFGVRLVRELDGLMLALDEQTHATRHIGSHIERVASAAEEFGLAARQSAHTASTLLGVVNRLDGEVAHGLSQAYTVKRATA